MLYVEGRLEKGRKRTARREMSLRLSMRLRLSVDERLVMLRVIEGPMQESQTRRGGRRLELCVTIMSSEIIHRPEGIVGVDMRRLLRMGMMRLHGRIRVWVCLVR